MTTPHLLRVAKVRRGLLAPILVFVVINAVGGIRELVQTGRLWMLPITVLFDSLLWIGVTFLIFAVIERRQRRPPQPRLAAMALATVGMSSLAMTLLTVRAVFKSIMVNRPFAVIWLDYLPGAFFNVTVYIAIVTGIGYAVYSWAVEDRRLAEEAELDAAVARAELKAASGRLQPEWLDAELAHLSTLMTTDPAAARHRISDLGAMLHDSLAKAQIGNRDDAVVRSPSS